MNQMGIWGILFWCFLTGSITGVVCDAIMDSYRNQAIMLEQRVKKAELVSAILALQLVECQEAHRTAATTIKMGEVTWNRSRLH